MKSKLAFPFLILIVTSLACQTLLPQNEPAADHVPATVEKTIITIPPMTESQVQRIDIHEAKAALDSGQAVLVDVRSVESYANGHAAGAISIPLANIENNPTKLSFAKDQWIITYCT